MTSRARPHARRLWTLSIVIALCALAATGLVAGQQGPTIHVSDVKITPGETETLTVSISGLENGIAGYSLDLSVADPDIATIVNVTHSDALASTADPTFSENNSTVTVSAPDRYNRVQAADSEVMLFTLTLRGGPETGRTTITASRYQIDSDDGQRVNASIDHGLIGVNQPATVYVPSDRVSPGGTKDLTVSIRDLDYGLSKYRMTLTLGDPSAANITGVSYVGGLGATESPEIAPDNSSITVAANDTSDLIGEDDQKIDLIRLTIRGGDSRSNTTLNAVGTVFVDDDGDRMAHSVRTGRIAVRTPNPFGTANLYRTLLMISSGGFVLIVVAFARVLGLT